jgi:hypothetical protein
MRVLGKGIKGAKVIQRETSRDAYQSVDVGHLRGKVLAMLKRLQGATCDEAQIILSLTHQSCSPCFTWLSKDGQIYDSGQRRVTRSGRKAIVWRVSDTFDTLFPDRKQTVSDLKDQVIRHAILARDTGDWSRFQESLGILSARKANAST